MTDPIRVVVADDQALLRGSFRLLLDSEPDFTVIGEAATGAEAVELAVTEKPDVVLMDVRMPVMDGIEATRLIGERVPDVRVLVLTMFDLDEHVFAALRAGATGFLLKDTRPADLCAAVRVVASGDALLGPSITRRLVAQFARIPDAPPLADVAALAPREREVLILVASGLSNVEITERMQLSMATVKTYVGRLLAKLDARDRAQLVIAAYESGLVRARN
ncbi:response regulator [Amycolatopsis circi]|uniref:response regulator n=1 Tax=Amycolatopsis circi TaxID=871959 RepID=UPI000E252649|nr:response regulator transcription factor [Amycolatopsis circi]